MDEVYAWYQQAIHPAFYFGYDNLGNKIIAEVIFALLADKKI